MPEPYGVIIETFCERHYIKDFKKKYSKRRWRVTKEAITALVRNPKQATEETSRLEILREKQGMIFCKGKFKPHGIDVSAKKSGWRFIVLVNPAVQLSRILFIYHKSHVKGSHENAWIEKMIKENFSAYASLL